MADTAMDAAPPASQDSTETEANAENKEDADELGQGDSKRVKFGTRYLTDRDEVWKHNAWDNVEWSEEQLERAKQLVKQHGETKLPDTVAEELEAEAASKWDAFYSVHENRFFKNRKWLFTEFPELAVGAEGDNSNTSDMAGIKVLEVGCGVGNTVLPLLKTNSHPDFFVYACDISETAVDILNGQLEGEKRAKAFVHDLASPEPLPIEDGTLDVITMIFVLSAIRPDHFANVMRKLAKALKPGGLLLFRDYGRYDLAQLRFKKNRMISDNFYMRGDGTRVYFFTQEEADHLFTDAGLVREENGYDKRLIVNRKEEKQMYRCWLQCKYRKPASAEHSS